jgi:hypothetical protein
VHRAPGPARRRRGWLLPAIVAIAVAASPAEHGRRAGRVADRAAVPRQPSFPIRAAFFYAWYPENWKVGGRYPHFDPTAGYYSSAAAHVQRAQIRALVYARMDAAIASWSGRGGSPDARLRRLLAETVRLRAPLKWAVYHEREGRADPSPAAIASDLSHIRRRLAASPAYLRIRRRFVVFVYNADDRSCGVVRRWRAANARLGRPAYLVLKVFPGYRDCRAQPDAWHQYAPASPKEQHGHDAVEISPGFWRADERAPRLDRSLRRFRRDIRTMIRSRARWQLVTTFNEWGEGTAVESSRAWATPSSKGAYLDALHAALARRTSG